MGTALPIRALLERPDSLARLRDILASEGFRSRAAAGRRVCAEFGLSDALGRPRLASCDAALRELGRRGLVALPEWGRRRGPRGRPAGLDGPVPPPSGVPGTAGRVRGLVLVPVEGEGHRRLWNGLVGRGHPLGAALRAGCQVRYLVGSDHGWLGALGFSAAALRLRARDAWIGWDGDARAANVGRVTCLSRFLVRPEIRCRNLASMVLAMAVRRLAGDFMARYGFRPLPFGTFTGPEWRGSCFAGAGWVHVGTTAGRGRFAAPGEATPPKAVWLRPLAPDWRAGLGAPQPGPEGPEPLACGEGLDRACWAENEFGGAPLGDRRLSARLVRSAAIMADGPGAPFTAAAQGDRAATVGWQRLVDRPAESEVTVANVLAPHRERTLRRMADRDAVLLVQDGTDLNFATHPECGGLGIIGRNGKASSGTLGLHMHSTLAVGTDGIPLGVPRIEFDAPDGKADAGRPEGERKPARWLRGLRDASLMAGRTGDTRTVAVMDREADFLTLFAERERLGNVDILVRAKTSRRLGDGLPKLFDSLRASPAQGRLEIGVGRLSARRAAAGQKERKAREARTAETELRWETYDLPPPSRMRAGGGMEPVRLTAVHVREVTEPADGSGRLEWFLLTSLEVNGRADAERILRWYGLRWRVEDWHRILKSGCRAEHLNLRAAERIERAVAVRAVIAWRLAAMVMMGRETPELPAGILFSDTGIMALADFATDRGLPQPLDLGRAFVLMATLGGYLNRRKEAPPGQTVIWRGYASLAVMARTYGRLVRMDGTSLLYKRLRPDKSCVS